MAEGHITSGRNLLLNALNGGHPSALLPSLELVFLDVRQNLYEPDVPIDYVYFPIDGVTRCWSRLKRASKSRLVQ
jgi:hypothetical protein